MVMNVSTATGSTPSTKPANSLDTPQEIQDRFLKLLVAQLQNQDPLSPVDNTQITQQMSQISMVQGISNLNTTMNALLASQSSQAAGLIGHAVLLSGKDLRLAGGQAVGAASLAGAATDVQVDVLGAAGTVVDTLALGPRPAGDLSFAWDGKDAQGNAMPDGAYTFKVRATSGAVAVSSNSFSVAQVNGVTLSSTGPLLDLSNGSSVALSAIKKIL